MKAASSLFLLVFALLWCGGMFFIDSTFAPGFVRQLRATSFPTTTGWITQSEPTTPPRIKGKKRYRWTITYAYTAEGREWTGDRLSFNTIIFGDGSKQAKSLTAQYPVGQQVTVYYDPASPGEALLQPGLLPDHLLIALFLVPHHLVGLGLLLAAVGPLFGKLPFRRGAPVLRQIDDLRLSVRMPWQPPWVIGFIAFGCATFLAIFLVALTIPMPPSMFNAAAVWVILFAFAISMARRRHRKLEAGLADLTIDASARTVLLPIGFGRDQRTALPFDGIRSVFIRQLPYKTTRTTKGGWKITETHKTPTFELALRGPSEQPFPLARSSAPENLIPIAESLSQTFGWPYKTEGFRES